MAWWNSSSKDIRVKEDHLGEVLRPENRSALRQDTFNVNVEIFLRTDHRGCFCSIYSEHHHTEEDQTWFHPLWAFLHYFFPCVEFINQRPAGPCFWGQDLGGVKKYVIMKPLHANRSCSSFHWSVPCATASERCTAFDLCDLGVLFLDKVRGFYDDYKATLTN